MSFAEGMYTGWFSVNRKGLSLLVISAAQLTTSYLAPSFAVMLFKPKASAKFDLNALHLEAETFVDTVTPTPRTRYLVAVLDVFLKFFDLRIEGYLFYILATGFVSEQYYVRDLYKDDVLNAYQTDQLA
jgi:hypothetical protein